MKQGPTMTVFISSFFLILNKIKLFYKAHHNGPIKRVNISLKLKILRDSRNAWVTPIFVQ